MTSYFHRAPSLVHSESLMTDDDFSEIEIGRDGSRVYRPRSQTNSMSQGLMSNSAYSMYGSHFGGSNFGGRGYAKSHFEKQSVRSHRDEYPRNCFDSQSVKNHRNEYTESHFDNRSVRNYRNEYAKTHFDTRSVQSHTGFLSESFRSVRLPSEEITISKTDIENLIRVEVDRRLPQEVDRRLQHILQEQSRRPARKRRRYELDGQQRDSEENTDDETDRYSTYSTKTEYAMRYVKRSKREIRHPYARSEQTFFHGEPTTRHRRFNQSQMARSFSQHSLANTILQPQSLRPPSVMREINLRNLNCTVVTEHLANDEETLTTNSQVGKENLNVKSTVNSEGDILKKDHVFVKPSTLPCPKKRPSTFNAPAPPPPKVNIVGNQTKRLSDVNEMSEITENSSNDSMRPSFIKRKLFTQTLDVALEKENEKEDSHSESPLRNIYSSVPRPKKKHGKLVASQPTVKRNLFESVCMRDLIEQIVPQEKMNATTGILKKNTQRSSLHEAKLNPTKNKATLDTNPKLLTNQLCTPQESDYDSDIIEEALLESTLQRQIMNDQDNKKTTTNMKNTVQQKQNTKINKEGKEMKNILSKPNNNTSEKKNNRKSNNNVDDPKIVKKISNFNSPKRLTQKCNNKESRPENVVKKSNSKDLSNKQVNVKKSVPDEPQVPKQLNNSELLSDIVNPTKEKKGSSNEGNKPKVVAKFTTATNKEKETSKPITINKMQNDVVPEILNCSTVNNKTLNNSRSRKCSASNQREQFPDLADSMKEKKATLNKGNKPNDLSKFPTAANKERETSKTIAIDKVHNDLDHENQKCSTANKKTINSLFGNKRSASCQPNKPSKVMKTQSESKETKPSTQSTSAPKKGEQHDNKQDDSENEDQKRLHLDTPNNLSGELDVRRSRRKSVRPSRYIEEFFGVRRSARKSVRPSRFSDFSLNASKEVCRSSSASNAHKPREVTKDNRANPQPERPRSTSPTYTASDVDFSSPKKALSNRLVAKCKDQESKEPRRSPRTNLNSQKKTRSPVFKVSKQKISFGRKAKSPINATFQHDPIAVPEKPQSQTQAQDAAIDAFLEEDSEDDFTEQSLQRSQSFNSQPEHSTVAPAVKKTVKVILSRSDLNSSVLTRSASKSAERPRQKVQSPAFNVKKNNIARALKTSSRTRNSPSIAKRAKVTENPSTASNKLLEQVKLGGDSFLQSSEDERLGLTPVSTKQSRSTASNKLVEQVKLGGDSFLQSSEDERLGATKSTNATKQSRAIPDKTQSQTQARDAAIDSFLEDDSADDYTERPLQTSHSFHGSQPEQNLNSSVLTRSASKSAERPRQKVQSPAYNVKKNNIARALKTSSTTRNSPRIANKAKLAVNQSPNFKNSPRKSTPIRAKNEKSAISKSTNLKANVTSIENITSFKRPPPVVKAPASSQNNPRAPRSNRTANMSLRTTLSQSSIRTNRNKSQKLPKKILDLLGSDFAEEDSQEEIDDDADSNNIRERVDQMKKRRNRIAPSQSGSDLSIQSEMIKPTQALKNRAARTFNATQNTSQYVHGSQGNVRPRHELGMTSLAIGSNPGYRAMNNTRHISSNASVASFQSMRSFRTGSGKIYVPTLHF